MDEDRAQSEKKLVHLSLTAIQRASVVTELLKCSQLTLHMIVLLREIFLSLIILTLHRLYIKHLVPLTILRKILANNFYQLRAAVLTLAEFCKISTILQQMFFYHCQMFFIF